MMKMTFMFGLVVFGNLIDNVSRPKNVLIIFQMALSVCWILTGVLVTNRANEFDPTDHDFYIKDALF